MPLWAPRWAVTTRRFNFPVTIGNSGTGMPKAATSSPQLQISGKALVAAAYLSGQPNHLLGAWGSAGAYPFRIWRIWAALGLLEPDGHGSVKRKAEYKELDPTEKGHLNYVLGGMMAKAYAANKLGVPWLAHLSVATRAGYAIRYTGSRRPDYLGYANNQQDLVIAEAKGRQNPDKRLKADLDGKKQTGMVSHVNKTVPVKRYGILTEAPVSRAVSLYAVEPADVIQVDFDALQWRRAYYTFARQLADGCANDPRPGDGELWASMDLQVPEAILEWLDRERGLDAWTDVEERARDEAARFSRTGQVTTVLPDLLIMRTRG